MSKKINILLLIIFSIVVVSTVIMQSHHQHWSGQWDLDFWYIYNTSLMASGFGQEWFDHPATSFLSLYSLSYKIYSFLDSSFIYKIGDIVDSNEPDLVLQKLFFVTRIIDSINIILIVFYSFKIFNILSLKNFYKYFLIITLLISFTFFQNISIMNPEDWSVLFFIISFYYFLKFFMYEKVNFLIVSGIFFSLSFFSKISILFLFIFIIPLIPVFYEMYSTKVVNKIHKVLLDKFFYLFIGYLISLILYFAVQIFIFSKLAPFEKNAGLDVIMIFLINFTYLVFFLIFSKFNFEKFKIYFSIYLLFTLSFLLGPIIFFVLDFLNIAEFNPWILFHLTNPFNEMIRFVTFEDNASTGLANSIFSFLSNFFSGFLFDKFLYLGLGLIFTISIIKDYKYKNINNILLKFIILFSFIFNV
ncbi:MAG: hypothetical protein CMI76_00070, partial [Candidatus Pelagibacter sp.]|nr:hypothetical protein [Candidatus Pelagibacter sp.]